MKKLLFITFVCMGQLLCAQSNLLLNPGFENDIGSQLNIPYSINLNIAKARSVNTWGLSYTVGSTGSLNVVSAEHASGNQSMEVKLQTIDARYRFYLANDLKDISPSKYKLSFSVKANVADMPFRVDIIACSGTNYATEKELIGSTYDALGNVVTGREGIVNKTSTEWVEYTYMFDASALSSDQLGLLRLAIRPNCNASGSSAVTNKPITYWFDDFSLTEFSDDATSFTFEGADYTKWVANKGTATISTEHYKEGSKSLKWETNEQASLDVKVKSFKTGSAASFYLYSPTVTTDTLRVEFMAGTTVQKTANILLNFKGWRDFNRAYTEYASPTSVTIDKIRFTRLTKSTSTQAVYFDDVKFDVAVDNNRQFGYHMILDRPYFKVGTEYLDVYANEIDIALQEPTSDELAGITKLKGIFKQVATNGTATQLTNARNFVTSFNIVRNADGSVRGDALNTMSPTDKTFMTNLSNHVSVLAGSKVATDKELFNNLVDYILDQGIAEGINFGMDYSDYTAIRAIPKGFVSALEYYSTEQRTEMLKMIRWIVKYGNIYYATDNYLKNLNADIVTNLIAYYYPYAVYQTDNELVTRELKAITRFMERSTEYVPGENGILKPDGTGFHHKSHYNNYMYAFRSWIKFAHNLRATPFKISQEPYERMKKAVLAMYIMSTSDANDTRFTANSLGGRNPFGMGGTKIQVPKSDFVMMVEIGGDIAGKSVDDEMAKAYNYFFKTTKYTGLSEKDYTGFYQFNYSPIGVYRTDNWVATMRSATSKLWGSELYSKTNRFGRYQSHGSLEIMYDGTLATSGYPTDNGGGWDWNVIPGATTVHYTSWQEMMPAKNVTQRFDQYSLTKDFAGALAWDNCGMFSADFDQGDKWGGQHFTPTNLTFKKTVFAFGNMLISMGTDISASGNYANNMITATNLFQSIKSEESGVFIVNGTTIEEGYDELKTLDNDLWFITPQSTGYFVPKGNDNLQLKYGLQSSPDHTGENIDSPTSVIAAKAYLNHGIKETNKKYLFVAIPATTGNEMTSLAQQLGNEGGNIYNINAQSNLVHSLTYKPLNITAYSAFEAVDNLGFGIVQSISSQLLLMVKIDEESKEASFAVCNPNLNPVTDTDYGWRSKPTQASIKLKGEWINSDKAALKASLSSGAEQGFTEINITLSEGAPVYFTLNQKDVLTSKPEDIIQQQKLNWQYNYNKDYLNISFSESRSEDMKITLIDISGRTVAQKVCRNGTSSINFENIKKGVYIVQLSSANYRESAKCMF